MGAGTSSSRQGAIGLRRTRSFLLFSGKTQPIRYTASISFFCRKIAPILIQILFSLREPRKWLETAPSDSFVVADTEWAKNRWTYSADSLRFLVTLSSCWPLFTFNSGFFAFENPLYDEDELIDVIQSPEYRSTCLERKASPIDQPAINWLVLRKRRKIFNFTLPEQYMESTMAVDYGISPPETVTSRPAAPAFLHFAGPMFQENLPILTLFTSFLTDPERKRWEAQVSERRKASRWLEKWPFVIRLLNRLIRVLDGRFHVQPKF